MSLRLGAVVAAILWTGWMIWSIGSLAPADIIIFSICGVAFGYALYVALGFVLVHMRPPLRQDARQDSRQGVGDVAATEPSGLYAWTVWAGLMGLTGFATACLLDLVGPLIPSGDWHWLISSLFVIVVWPGLMWALRPLMKRHLPARGDAQP
jgi:hypothetical protein